MECDCYDRYNSIVCICPLPKIPEVIVDDKEPLERTWRDEWKEYKKRAWFLTEQVFADNKHNIAYSYKRAFKDYHLDHIISIWYCYKHNITPDRVAQLNNLRMIPYKDNMIKGRRLMNDDTTGKILSQLNQ